MGISYPVPIAVYEAPGNIQVNEHTVSTAAADWVFSVIIIPTWLQGKIEHAYLDVYFPYIQNTNAATNYVSSLQYMQVSADDITYVNAGGFTTGMLAIPGTTVFNGLICKKGGTDVGTTVEHCFSHSGYVYVKWTDADAQVDSLVFRFATAVLRIFARG